MTTVIVSDPGRPVQYPVPIRPGDSFDWQITLLDPDDETNATPLDLTGWTAQMQIRPYPESDQVLQDLTVAGGDITIVGAAGQIRVQIDVADTSLYDWSSAAYDLQITEIASGFARTVLYGEVDTSLQVTR